MPPTVPLTVLSRDERANDPSLRHAHAHSTTPGHIPAHLPPFETLRANRVRKVGWVELFRSTRGPSLIYGGPGRPAPLFGGWGQLLQSVCAQPLMGGRAAPPPCGGLGRRSRLCLVILAGVS